MFPLSRRKRYGTPIATNYNAVQAILAIPPLSILVEFHRIIVPDIHIIEGTDCTAVDIDRIRR